jgi:hypothetical protein
MNAVTVPADKLAELQLKAAQRDELLAILKELEEQIAGGIRVYVEYDDEHEMLINETAVSENMKNATLILDYEQIVEHLR